MLLIIILINLFLSYIAVGSYIKRLAPLANKALGRITALLVVVILISFSYYIIIVASASFLLLVGVWTVANLLGFFWKLKRKTMPAINTGFASLYNQNTIVVLSAILIMTVYFVMHASKYGNWDAWAIWNLHAKFLYGSQSWKNMFSPGLVYSHQDYPLMLPAITAFFWKAVGITTPLVPLGLAFLVMIAIPLVVYFNLQTDNKINLYSVAALLLFTIDHNFQSIAAYQVADPLLSLLILLTFVWFNNITAHKGNEIYIMAFVCASCAWLKNEGILFYIIFSVGFVITHIKQRSAIRKYLAGSLLPLAIALSFKIFYSPGNDLVTANHAHTTQMLTNISRYTTIAKAVLNMLVDNYAVLLVLLLAAALFSRKYFSSFTFMVICVMTGGYIFIYLTTPYDLGWHLSTSLNRLFLHFYPAIIYSALLSIRQNERVFTLGKHEPLNG